VREAGPTSASEDFGCFGAAWQVPSVFWFVGGTDPEALRRARAAGTLGELPTNHNPRFAPVVHPTLRAGVEAAVAAAEAWLAP
jgi:hippurate hydrolase